MSDKAPADPKTTRKPSLEVERDGWKVTLTFRCADHYAAMKLYDEVCAGARGGFVMIDVETQPRRIGSRARAVRRSPLATGARTAQ